MLNSLDLLIYVFIGLLAAAIVGVTLQFISKNKTVQRVGLYVSFLLAAVLSFCNLESTPTAYGSDIFAGFAFAALSIAAIVLQFIKKDDKSFKLARVLSAIAVLGALVVTFII